jgi:hypothetical protein
MTAGNTYEYKAYTNFFFVLNLSLHKTQYKGERVVYDVFTLLSDVGGFVGSIQLITGGAISLFYLPKLFEANFILNEKRVDRNKKIDHLLTETPLITKMNSSQRNMRIESRDLL